MVSRRRRDRRRDRGELCPARAQIGKADRADHRRQRHRRGAGQLERLERDHGDRGGPGPVGDEDRRPAEPRPGQRRGAVATAPAFTGTVAAYAITAGAGVTINATTGVITLAKTALQAVQTVTVRAANDGGYVEARQMSVVAAQTAPAISARR